MKGKNKDKTITMCEINNSKTKILGLLWSSTTDTLNFKVGENSFNPKIKLRNATFYRKSRVYLTHSDVGPTIVRAKLMLQRLW